MRDEVETREMAGIEEEERRMRGSDNDPVRYWPHSPGGEEHKTTSFPERV